MTLGLLLGSLLPVWSVLEKAVAACSADLSKGDQALKVGWDGMGWENDEICKTEMQIRRPTDLDVDLDVGRGFSYSI